MVLQRCEQHVVGCFALRSVWLPLEGTPSPAHRELPGSAFPGRARPSALRLISPGSGFYHWIRIRRVL